MFVGFLRFGCAWILDGGLTNTRQVPAGVSWEKIKTYTIHTPCEAEGTGFPRIGPAFSSTSWAIFPESQPPWALHYTWDSWANVLDFFDMLIKRGGSADSLSYSGCKILQTFNHRNSKGHILSEILCFR